MSEKGFAATSYDLHKEHGDKVFDLKRIENKGTVDYWRHERMYNALRPFLGKESSNWLTVGDGVATDANWLKDQGEKALASDIADSTLKRAKELGYIDDYKAENAENLQFEDNEFDFVLCKEAFHHFPRPYIALYEMIRVSKGAVILIEPNDIGIQMPLIIFLKNILDRVSTKLIDKIWKNRYSFESVGNYVYKFSEREAEKVAMGMNLPYVGFKGINDYHSDKVNLVVPMDNKKVLNKVKSKIRIKNILCKLGLVPYGNTAFVLFKTPPSEKIMNQLNREGYKMVALKKNPYT